VDLLLERGAVPDGGVVGTGWTALHSAALADRLGVVRRFLAHGADPSLAASDGRRPVHVALERGAVAVAGVRANPGFVERSPEPLESVPLLHLAALCGNADAVDVLLDAGADPGARGEGRGVWAGTALHLAAERGRLDAARRLLDRGAPADANLGRGTPLHFAAAAGHLDVALLLLEGGAFVDARQQGPDSGTPLHFAAANGRADVVELLLTRGADRTATSRGATPLARALKSGDRRTIELLRAP
jgi:ankyrin repeat protein